MTHFELIDFQIIEAEALRFSPDWFWDTSDSHTSKYQLWYVVNGGATIRSEKKIVSLEPGDIYIFNHLTNHHCTHDRKHPLSVFSISFDFDSDKIIGYSTHPYSTILSKSHRIQTKDSLMVQKIFEKLVRSFSSEQFASAHVWINAILAVCFEQKAEGKHDIIDDIIDIIKSNPKKNYSLDDLSLLSGYSKNHFLRLFKNKTNMTPINFIISNKIHHARHLLSTTAMSINEIADAIGYSNLTYFSKQFKTIVGISPNKYRNFSQNPYQLAEGTKIDPKN